MAGSKLAADGAARKLWRVELDVVLPGFARDERDHAGRDVRCGAADRVALVAAVDLPEHRLQGRREDRKSTRLNSSHPSTSYAVFRLRKQAAWAIRSATCSEI